MRYVLTMEPHQSSDRKIPEHAPNTDPTSPSLRADGELNQMRFSTDSIHGRNFIITLGMRSDKANPFTSITVEIFSQDRIPIAAYRTDSIIPEAIGREILRPEKLALGRKEPQFFLKNMVRLLENNFPAEWSCTEFSIQPRGRGRAPTFRSVTPSLIEFADRPSIVDERLSATVHAEQGPVSLEIRMSPDQGHMRCALLSGSEIREWKIPARIEQTIDQDSLRADLTRKSDELLIRLHLDGLDAVTDLLNSGHFNARAVPHHQSVTYQIDSKLSRGYIPAAERSTSLEPSLAEVSLQIGTRYAAIQIVPCSHDTSQSTSIVFACSERQRELNGFQLHHIETAHKMLTSSSHQERHDGLMMCELDKARRRHPFTRQPSGDSAHVGITSIGDLRITLWGPTPDMNEFVDQSAAHEIFEIPNICVFPSGIGSRERVQNMLDGGREMSAVRSSSPRATVDGHCFHTLRCIRYNDNSIRATLTNAIGGSYDAMITPSRLDQHGDPSMTITSLFQTFATSTGDRWMDVVGHIEKLCGELGGDAELLGFDPTRHNVPPFEDRIGAAMLRESVRTSAFICALPNSSQLHMNGTIEYAGPGCARILFSRNTTGPVLKFILKDYALREVTISRPIDPKPADGAPTVHRYRFVSEGIPIGSASYIEILQAAHTYATQAPLNLSLTFWKKEFVTLVTPLTKILSEKMRCVLRDEGENA